MDVEMFVVFCRCGSRVSDFMQQEKIQIVAASLYRTFSNGNN